MGELVLVGCSGPKLAQPAPARDLYVSSLFVLARKYAETREEAVGARWAILSAKHGLVLPDQELAPYDVSFRRFRASREERTRWAWSVRAQLREVFPSGKIVFLAGEDYRPAVDDLPAWRLSEPLRGLGIGRRLQWLRRQVELAARRRQAVSA